MLRCALFTFCLLTLTVHAHAGNVLYQSYSTSGTIYQYQRSQRMVINNPYEGTPVISFHEETIKTLPDGTVLHQAPVGRHLSQKYTDPNNSFYLIDPSTGNVIGTGTDGQLYNLRYSKYFDMVKQRDASQGGRQ